MKRYCQTLTLKDAASVELYSLGQQCFMVVDTRDDFDWDRDMAKVASEDAAARVRKLNLAEFLEKGIVK